jgi:type I restriction enzyme S subunit
MFYWLQASKQPIIDLYAVGGGQPNINQEVVASLKVPAPNMDEQATIVAALDHETARIDALVTKKTTLIELLKEKRRAVITHTITKGLEPYVKMKDSGMEWLGAIPAHWRLMKFGRVARVTDGLVDPRVEPYRTMSLFAPNHIESGTGRLLAIETSAEQDAESGKYLCKAGAVVYSKIRPALAKVIIAPTDGLCSADMYPLTCSDKVEPRWLFYLMLSQAFTAWAVLESDRVAMPKINRESLSELAVAVPPLAEQREVVSSIDSRLHKIDIIFQKVEASIALLRERRSAFITAAVTGQIDLRQEP